MLTTTTRPPVNGIDLVGLDETMAAIGADPRCGQAAFTVTTEWKGQTRSETTVSSCTLGGERVARNFTIVADEPMELLGDQPRQGDQSCQGFAHGACLAEIAGRPHRD